jgi:hypothetical protein
MRTQVVAMSTGRQSEFDQRTALEKRVRSMRRWRLAISSAGLVLGVVLVLTGKTLVGVIIGGLAAARLVMFARFAFSHRGRPRRLNADERDWLRTQARNEFLVAAQVVGCPARELRHHFAQGKSIADIATERSVALPNVIAAIAADLAAKARDASAMGTLSENDAQRIRDLAPRIADRLVHGHRGDFT